MKSKATLAIAAAAAASILGMANAEASIIYQYVTYVQPAAVTTYVTTPGVAVQIPIYLYESLSGNSTSLIAADGGLYGAGFSITQDTATAGAAGIALSGNSSNFSGSTFGTASGSEAKFTESDGIASSGTSPNAVGEILLGYARITPSGGGIDTYTLSHYTYPTTPNASGDGYTTTFGNGPGLSGTAGPADAGDAFDLDSNNTGTYAYTGTASAHIETFTIVSGVVPEPATAGIAAISALALLGRRRRRSSSTSV